MSGVLSIVHNYAELSRLSNIPTVLTNVLVGCAIGASGQTIPVATIVVVTTAMMLMYIAGMALNDFIDTEINLTEGWNLLGVVVETIRPSHPDIVGKIWKWNPILKQFKPVIENEKLVPGFAYWIYVRNSMTLFGN